MPQVFGCPNCQNPFQVPDDAAGQTFQCPTCKATVEVPANEEPDSEVGEPEIFACPHCGGQFGIDSTMYGQQLSCPHCEQLVAVGAAPPQETEPIPEIDTESKTDVVSDPSEPSTPAEVAEPATESESGNAESEHEGAGREPVAEDNAILEEEQPPEVEPVFEPQPVDHLLPPRFEVPDPVRFPTRIGSDEVILPDGAGGYRAVDANIVTITHNGEVYHLKRLTPEQRRRRKIIHNAIAIGIAVVLIYLTLRTLGVVS